ncbi:MAG: HAMP domain-containing sensor histidine kinase [Geminicoccaceae bacterium]
MSSQSLRLRLLLAQAASVAVALVLAGIGLTLLFERHLESRVDAELATYVRQLAAQLGVDAEGALTLGAPLADPRFAVPLSGLYWQIEEMDTGELHRSRSLWDNALPLPEDEPGPGQAHRHELPGPGHSRLLVHERLVRLADGVGERRIRIAAAVDRATLDAARADYVRQLATALAGLALVLIAAAAVQVWYGLRPFEAVRRAVTAVREGRTKRLDGRFPDEIRPLVQEVDALLEAQERSLTQARQRAADLAHGLKTPLTVLGSEARALAARGENRVAAELDGLALDMRRHIERELARTRLAGAAGRGQATALAPVIERLVRTLRRTPAGSARDWRLDVPEHLEIAVEADYLGELLGNLLDNAAKWARSVVSVEAVPDTGNVLLTIADDGPGVDAAGLDRLGTRGHRLDTAKPGHGIGLAIARDIAQAYGGAIAFANRPEGGLRVTLTVPAAQSPTGQASMR